LIFGVGNYLDRDETKLLQVFAFIMVILFAPIPLLPIMTLKLNLKLPPLTGLFMLPLTNLQGRRSSGAKFYCVMLTLQYLGIMASLALTIMLTYDIQGITLFHISIPVCFSFTVIPALTMPGLFWFNTKGRHELLFIYTIMFPFWGPLMMAAAHIDCIVEIDTLVMFLPMYLAFVINILLGAMNVVCIGVNNDKCCHSLLCAFVFGVAISIPTYLVMPLLFASIISEEPATNFTSAFSPVYIDIIFALAISILSLFVKYFTLKYTSRICRLGAKVVQPHRYED